MLLRFLIPVFILIAGAIAAWRLGIPAESPKPQPAPPLVMKTEVVQLQRSDYPVRLESQGSVRAHYTTTITPQVEGIVIAIHERFEDGAFFAKDAILAELDPADFQLAVATAESRLARAEAVLIQEEARAKQARLNWQDLGYDEAPSDLVLRVPQLKEAKSGVAAAQADLAQALRNLERTKIRAPFDGRVQRREVGLGQAVGASTPLGQVFATDFAEIRLPLTPRQLEFVRLPSRPDDPALEVVLTDALGGKNSTQWKASLVRTEGAIDESSRELFVIARIEDPFGLISDQPPLRIGQPVRASIQGVVLKEVFVLPRHALRGVNRVYLVERPQNSIRRILVDPVWTTTEELVVRDGLEAGQWLSVTRLPYAPDGAPVEPIESQAAASPSPASKF